MESFGAFFPVSTTWTYTVTYDGVTTKPATPQMSGLTNATLYLPTPGDYALTAVTTYQSTNPSSPPAPPTTYTANFTVAPPSTVTKYSGIDTPTSWHNNISISSIVSSSAGQIGPYLAGTIQEYIPPYQDFLGNWYPGSGDWIPTQSGTSFYVSSGRLYDQFGFSFAPGVWNNIIVDPGFETTR